MPLPNYNPFPHIIAASGIEHTSDCPGCSFLKDFTDFVLRVLDRLAEESTNDSLLGRNLK